MPKNKTILKTKNALYLWTFIGANCAVFLAVIIGAQLDYASVQHFWQRISAKDGLIAACMPLATVVLNGALGDLAKARLVFWRWKNPLPGCRAFTVLVHFDPRIDVAVLKARYGPLPRSPRDQNSLWFQIYKKQADALTVADAHRLYLLTRDMASISALFGLALSLCAFLSSLQREWHSFILSPYWFNILLSRRRHGIMEIALSQMC